MGCMRFGLFLSFALIPALVLSACGDDDGEPSGPGGSDEDYLRAICSGVSDFSNALISKTTPNEIGEVIRDFIEEMKATDPPSDLRQYNDEFVKYLEDSVNDPTSLVTRQPPLPPDDAQRRLAAKEATVDECKDGTFFSRTLQE